MIFSLSIDYWDESVLCFDPQKVVMRFRDWFPGCEVDPTDYAAGEVARLEAFLASSDAMAETRETMLRQIQGKNWRNGPAFRFRSPAGPTSCTLSGITARYYVRIESDGELDAASRTRLTDFLQSLGLGELEIYEDKRRC